MGRARVTLTYTDGSQHVASYFVLPPLHEHLAKYGGFMANTAWYGNESDPFGRGLSVLGTHPLPHRPFTIAQWGESRRFVLDRHYAGRKGSTLCTDRHYAGTA